MEEVAPQYQCELYGSVWWVWVGYGETWYSSGFSRTDKLNIVMPTDSFIPGQNSWSEELVSGSYPRIAGIVKMADNSTVILAKGLSMVTGYTEPELQ